MLQSVVLSAALVGTALAKHGYGYGKPPGYSSKPIHVTADFDDLTALPVINDLLPIGSYKYLNYEGLSVGSEEIPLTGVQLFGVHPSSAPNYAYSSPVTDLFAGPALVAAGKTKAFDLKSFYYACVDIDSTPVATPENCDITVTGYQGDTVVATQQFVYDLDNLPSSIDLDAPMVKAKLSKDFVSLTRVEIAYTESQFDTPPAFLGDDFKYTVYLKK